MIRAGAAAAAVVGLAPFAFGATVFAGPTALAGPTPVSCATAGATGLTAAVVASPGQRIDGATITAAGCDVGIYVGPGVEHVVIDGATVTDANDHGIFVQDTSYVTIENSTISGNGVDPTAGIAENKAVEVVGTTDSLVRGNTVTGNLADGGVGFADDGYIDPGAPNPGALLASTYNVVSGNRISGNYVGCGIVLAAYDAGAGVFDNVVVGNTVTGTVGFTSYGPVIGGIVVAADTPGTTVSNNTVVHNTDTDSFIPGIIVHSNSPGDVVSNNSIVANTLNGDGWGKIDGPAEMVGILVGAAPGASLTNTTVAANRLTDEDYGIYLAGASGTHLGGLPLDRATTPVVGLP
jgi:parallel beta-helix repeat protein